MFSSVRSKQFRLIHKSLGRLLSSAWYCSSPLQLSLYTVGAFGLVFRSSLSAWRVALPARGTYSASSGSYPTPIQKQLHNNGLDAEASKA